MSHQCKLCNRYLESLCKQRAWWFRAIHALFSLAMRAFAAVCGIKPDSTLPPSCRLCLRHQKSELKRTSGVFRFFNRLLDPIYDKLRNSLVTQEELDQAKIVAQEHSSHRC